MITNRKEAELFGAFIHISRLMELSKNVLNTNEYEKLILETIKENPEVLKLQTEDGKNIGMLACESELFFVVNRCLKDRTCRLQQDKNDRTIGHYLASKQTTPIYDSNWERQEDIIDLLVRKVLKDNVASILQDCDGNNIGMLVAKRKSPKVLALARKNEVAMKQENKRGETIDSIARDLGLLSQKERTK